MFNFKVHCSDNFKLCPQKNGASGKSYSRPTLVGMLQNDSISFTATGVKLHKS